MPVPVDPERSVAFDVDYVVRAIRKNAAGP
jgi:hypothetical protein